MSSEPESLGTQEVAPANAFIPLQRDNLKDQIAHAIRTEILTGRMETGKVYKAGEMAERFGASRTPVREAILQLESKGLVEVTTGVGFRVVTPSPEELANAVAIRRLLEIPTVASLAGKLNAETLQRARELINDVRAASVRNDLVEYLSSDMVFHLFLVSQAHNRKLTEIVSDLRDAHRVVPKLAQIAEAGDLLSRNAEHVAIIDAIEAGDSEEVSRLMTNHLAINSPD